MAGFVQIIEFQTSRIDEMQALAQERRAQLAADTAPHRVTWTADRDRPGYYLAIAESSPMKWRWRTPAAQRSASSPLSWANCARPRRGSTTWTSSRAGNASRRSSVKTAGCLMFAG